MSVSVIGNFLEETREFFERLPQVAEEAALMSVNQVSERFAVPMFRREMESQIDFPRGYLKLENRFGITKKANRGDLRAVISGRDRPTSLARFITSTSKTGITVRVHRGRATRLKKAFVVKLKNGNQGLAIRLPKGERPQDAYKPVELDMGVWLLYGPSVDQVFRGTIVDKLPEVGQALSKEFFRQFARLSRG